MAVKKYRPVLGFQDHKYHAEMEEAADGQYVKIDSLKEVLIEWSILMRAVGDYTKSPSMENMVGLFIVLQESEKFMKGFADETVDRRV